MSGRTHEWLESGGVIWTLTRRELRQVVCKKLFWLGVFFPILGPLFVLPVAFLAYRSKSHTVIICHEAGLEQTAHVIEYALSVSPGPGGTVQETKLLVLSSREMDARRLEFSQEIRDSKLLAFLEIRRGEEDFPEVHLFSEPMNTDSASLKERLGIALVFMDQYSFTPDISLRSENLHTPEFVDHAPLRNAGDGGAGPIELLIAAARSGLVLVLSMVVSFNIQMATGPLRVGLSKEKESRILEVLLTSFEIHELILARYLSALIIGFAVLSLYALAIILPAYALGILSGLFAIWFLLFAYSTLVLEAAISLAVGAVSKDAKDSLRLSAPFSLLSMLGSIGIILVLQAPNSSFARAICYIPNVAGSICPARIALVKDLPWWDIALPYLSLSCTALYLLWLTIKLFQPDILLGDKTLSWKLLIPGWSFPTE